MRKLTLAMQMTLDGFIEGPDKAMDWLVSTEEEWKQLFFDLQSVDTVLLGRKMYPGYSGYWRSVLTDPSADKNEKEYAKWAERTPHIVFSNTMSAPDWKNTRVAKDAAKEVAQLKQQSGKDIIVWGGATMAASLINLGLIDEYRITLNPMLLGGGLTLFDNLKGRHHLALVDARPLGSGLVVLRYRTKTDDAS